MVIRHCEADVEETSPGKARRRVTSTKQSSPRQGRPPAEVHLTTLERKMLVAIINSQHLSGRRRVAAQIILACSAGEKGVDIAARIGITARTVSRWRMRFVDARERTLRVARI